MANSTASKTAKAVKTLATYVAEWNKISETFEMKIRKAESDKVDAQAKLVAEMSIKGAFSDVAIANALGITKDYAGKLVARGVVVIVGLDGVQGSELIKSKDSKVTVSAIKKIAAPNRKQADIKSDLVAMGVPERGVKRRESAINKAKQPAIVKVRTQLDTWVKQAQAGKIDKYELGALLDGAINALDEMND